MNTRTVFEPSGKTEEPAYQGQWSPRIGRLVVANQSDEIWVESDGFGPRVARLVSGISREELVKSENNRREVLLVFEEGDINRPIIMGLMENPLEKWVSMEIPQEAIPHAKELLIDGERVTIEGKEEIVLKCGEGSITLRKDGKIIIKGTHLLSRASGPNRIKGGSVQIN